LNRKATIPRRKNRYSCSSLYADTAEGTNFNVTLSGNVVGYTGGSQTQVATQIRVTQGMKKGRERVLWRIRFLYL